MNYYQAIAFLQRNYIPLDYTECQHRPEFKNNTGIVVRLLYDVIRHQLEQIGTILKSSEVLIVHMNVCEHSGLLNFSVEIKNRVAHEHSEM